MAKRRHKTIPIFLPELACPAQCVYCNQRIITGQHTLPSPAQVRETIVTYLSTVTTGEEVEVGFFGGTFTGLPPHYQRTLLEVVRPFRERGTIGGIRLSTRPDYIDASNLRLLREAGVTTVELGVQSMDDAVLHEVKRGYNAAQVRQSADRVKSVGLRLGIQLMLGLPGDTAERTLASAETAIEIGADDARLYPTLVIADTEMEQQYRRGTYHPLTTEEAVRWAARPLRRLEEAGVTVLRVGLHPTQDFLQGTGYVAGPFHVSFKELVQTAIFADVQRETLRGRGGAQAGREAQVWVAEGKRNVAIGYGAANKKRLLEQFVRVRYAETPQLKAYEMKIETK